MSPKSRPNSSKDNADQDAGASTQRQSLPFEPKRRKQSDGKPDGRSEGRVNQSGKSAPVSAAATRKPENRNAASTSIPEVVSRRMARRMALFCGVPTFLGMSTFVVSYLVVSNDLINLPTYAVLLVSLGWFGLGVVGLTYGVLSASWDEDAVGSRLGWAEFTTNWQRMTSTWRANSEKNKAERSASEPAKGDKKS
jgi:hypothetical protein